MYEVSLYRGTKDDEATLGGWKVTDHHRQSNRISTTLFHAYCVSNAYLRILNWLWCSCSQFAQCLDIREVKSDPLRLATELVKLYGVYEMSFVRYSVDPSLAMLSWWGYFLFLLNAPALFQNTD
jgi:hypothetical protein